MEFSYSWIMKEKMNIPEDIWKYEIYPFLDYDSRINLNQILPPTARGSKKLSKNALKQHGSSMTTRDITRRVIKLNNLEFGWIKTVWIIDFFTFIRKPLFQHVFHFIDFRKQFLKKCREFHNCAEIDIQHQKLLNQQIFKARKIVRTYKKENIKNNKLINVYDM
jgi:hypothetical protein